MSISSGFMAGLSTGGRYGGIGSALKQVLAGMQTQQTNQTTLNTQMMRNVGAQHLQSMEDSAMMERTRYIQGQENLRKMMEEGYTFDEQGNMIESGGTLPQEMTDAGYMLYKGKPYKTKSIGLLPGEEEAMEFAYMDYVYNNIKKTNPEMASILKTKMEARKRLRAAEMLGVDADAVDSPGERTWLQRTGSAMLDLFKKGAGF
jgi:hypothetical protein